MIVSLYGNAKDPEVAANADLITAAPDMLKAIIEAERVLSKDVMMLMACEAGNKNALYLLRSAIQSASGANNRPKIEDYTYHLWIKTRGEEWINPAAYDLDQLIPEIDDDTKCYIAHKAEQSIVATGVFKFKDVRSHKRDLKGVYHFSRCGQSLRKI